MFNDMGNTRKGKELLALERSLKCGSHVWKKIVLKFKIKYDLVSTCKPCTIFIDFSMALIPWS